MWSPDQAVKGHSCEHDQRTLQAKRGSYTGFAMMHVVHVRSDQVELVTSTHRPDRQDILAAVVGGDVAVTCSCTSWLLWLIWAEWFNSSSSTSCCCPTSLTKLQCLPICFAWSCLWEDEFQRISRSNGEADSAPVGNQTRDSQLVLRRSFISQMAWEPLQPETTSSTKL